MTLLQERREKNEAFQNWVARNASRKIISLQSRESVLSTTNSFIGVEKGKAPTREIEKNNAAGVGGR